MVHIEKTIKNLFTESKTLKIRKSSADENYLGNFLKTI